ncbi:MAG TPA: flavin reductase family protein, partial [Nitrospiria bacterium]
STLGADGLPNAAPFSFFSLLSAVPPLVGVAIARRGVEKKGTLLNLESTGEFVINVVDEALAEEMTRAAGNFLPNTDKFAAAGLTAAPCAIIKTPRIAEAPVSLECRLSRVLDLPESKDQLVIGRVIQVHLREDLLENGSVDPNRLKAIGRMGQFNYCRAVDIFEMGRPSGG